MAMAFNPPFDLMNSIVVSFSNEMQSHKIFPFGVRIRKARWPMANLGMVLISYKLSLIRVIRLLKLFCKSSIFVQAWPFAGRYCRSLLQTGQFPEVCLLSTNWVPQVEQNNGFIS